MLYMIIERFKPGAAVEIYRRFRAQGRMLPEGLEYLSSWVDHRFNTCFQLMQTDNEALFQEWIGHWQDLADFEIVPVLTSVEAGQAIAPHL